MRLLRLPKIEPGMVLARPARSLDGAQLMRLGQVLDVTTIDQLRRAGLQEVWVVGANEKVPDPTVPEYMDRYGPDFASRLQQVFSRALVNRGMQHLFLQALAHASDCYRRYRLDDES